MTELNMSERERFEIHLWKDVFMTTYMREDVTIDVSEFCANKALKAYRKAFSTEEEE